MLTYAVRVNIFYKGNLGYLFALLKESENTVDSHTPLFTKLQNTVRDETEIIGFDKTAFKDMYCKMFGTCLSWRG